MSATDTKPANQAGHFPHVPTKVSFPELEEGIQAFWKEERIFERSVEEPQKADAPDYVFYDGPPFATGLPHYGHILTTYIKDTVPRFFTMRGHAVERRFGWDCHGLPIENEIEKELGLRGKASIEEYGIAKFNDACRGAVTRYTEEWEQIITRLGRWVDFDNDYKTMDLDYMESVMHVFKRLFDKGLVYLGEKVVPYSYGVQSPLSNFEAKLDDSFRARQDPSVTARFRLLDTDGDRPEYVLAWTTTPWTLPSNVALAVGPKVDYVKIAGDDGDYWLAEARRDVYAKELPEDAEVLATATGADLVGRPYEPLFPYFGPDVNDFGAEQNENAFTIRQADFVTTEDGTGIVHIAPAFGEEDFELGQRDGLPRPCPVDVAGKFTDEVTDFAGENVHDANKGVIRWLKEQGKLVRQETIEHNYPHCWRTDTPLIYRTIPSWYVNVLKVKETMQACNQQINWAPSHIRDGRFGDWLANARDWAISRSRYWGAPIPVWICDKSGDMKVPGSVAELEEWSGQKVDDLHRPAIDEVEWASEAGGTYRRVPDVLDCWFESGSMPYGQVHYPFEREQWFEEHFPADFIVEYIAQTRGWFYTLVVLGAALFERPPFKNCLCHGVVLAEDGRKMSKRLKNYPDPMEIVHEFGSDALRIALLSSPVVRGGNLKFSQKLVEEALRNTLIPLWNAYHFFTAYANIDGWTPDESTQAEPANHTDRYILAKLEEVKAQLVRLTESYQIVECYEALIDFIERLNNWFIRLSRRRFWSGEGESTEDKNAAYSVLYTVLREFSMAAAPYIPFTAEAIYRGLTGSGDSVHLQDWPERHESRVDHDMVANAEAVQRTVYLGRYLREKHRIKTRQPLARVQVAGLSPELLTDYSEEIGGELNVKSIEHLADPDAVVDRVFKPDPKKLGPKFGKDFKTILQAAKAGEAKLLGDGRAEVAGHILDPEDFSLDFTVRDEGSGVAVDGDIVVVLSLEVTPELEREGIARDVVRAVQDMRKQADLAYTDRIEIGIESGAVVVAEALEEHRAYITDETLADALHTNSNAQSVSEKAQASCEVSLAGENARVSVAVAPN